VTFTELVSDEIAAHFMALLYWRNAAVIFPISGSRQDENGCVGPLNTQQIRNLNKGLSISMSTGNISGEIRGQVLPVVANVKY
jgi:hypothetical protein